mmetsp:Transcript_46241/g.91209  ORF Transcript_46241/g.91209 Transcript_46241/m.91209 type:complete len:83 (+) Transcript_46241:691-939(+)
MNARKQTDGQAAWLSREEEIKTQDRRRTPLSSLQTQVFLLPSPLSRPADIMMTSIHPTFSRQAPKPGRTFRSIERSTGREEQ